MNRLIHLCLMGLLAAIAASALCSQLFAAELFREGFDSSAADVKVNRSADSAVDYVDYSNFTVGATNFVIPEAPNMDAGSASTHGVLLRVNHTGQPGGTGAPAAINMLAGATPLNFSGNYMVSYDVYMNTINPHGFGPTQQALFGLGTNDDATLEASFNRGGGGTVGTWGWLTNENGSADEDSAINQNSIELADIGDVNAADVSAGISPLLFNQAFADTDVPTTNNSAARQWVSVQLRIIQGQVSVAFNGVTFFGNAKNPIINSTANDGHAMLGFDDRFASISESPDLAWALFDNFVVTEIPTAQFSIFQWEYVNPQDPSQGKRQSAFYTPDGYGLHAEPGLVASNKNLPMAYLVGTDLTGANFTAANLTSADFSQANLTGARFTSAILTNADFSGANVQGAYLGGTNLTAAQLASTASYQAHDLSGIQLSGNNLSRANLSGQNLANANLQTATLTRANFNQANLADTNLSGANLTGANLTDANLTDAIVKNAKLSSTHITLDQLYSTASYQEHDLTGVHFIGNDLSGANLAGQQLTSASFYAAKLVGADLTNADLTNAELVNADVSAANLTGANFTNAKLVSANLGQAILTNANFNGADLTGTNLMGADVRGARLGGATTYVYGSVCGRPSVGGCLYYTYGVVSSHIGGGVNLAQLTTTASYQAQDLRGIDLSSTNLAGANFAGFNLTNANFTGATLTGANLSGADARGASGLSGFAAPNFIGPDGHIVGLTLGAGQSLDIRDYDGGSSGTIPITVDQQPTMASGATLRMIFEADAWDSTISFAAGIPVMLGGSLELSLAAGVDPISQIGRTFDIFDWTGVSLTGTFAIDGPYVWDLSNLYTTGKVTFLAASGSGGIAQPSTAIPEPNAFFLLSVGLIAAWMTRRTRPTLTLATPLASACRLLPILALLILQCDQALAAPPEIQLTKIGAPIWKPIDFQLFSAPATPFDAEFGQVYNTLLPYDTPIANSYTPHAPPYDTEVSAGMTAGGYVSQSVFIENAITLQPNGVYFAYMMVPAPGTTGSSRDFTSGPIIPNALFPIGTNVDVWLDGVLVDRVPGADAQIPVQPKDVPFQGTSHLDYLFAIWHPWDDDLTVGPLGNYDLRVTLRDVSGSGWDVIAPFQVVANIPPGDFNNDHVVDAADYVVWRKNPGGIYTQGDYIVWRSHFGQTAGSGAAVLFAHPLSATVPEPATLLLFSFGLAAMVAKRRARPTQSGGERNN